MKYLLFIFICLSAFKASAQLEGQDFCNGVMDGDYFPVSIEKKKIIWYKSYYLEELTGQKVIKNITYNEYRQTWSDGSVDMIYLRKQGDKVLQYEECCENETIRFDKLFSIGNIWNNAEKTGEYTLISFDADLNTPYCHYKNLLAIKAQFKKATYIFYYQKGHGYVGATSNGKTISWVTPEW